MIAAELARLVAQACPRSRRTVLVSGASPELLDALRSHGLDAVRRPAASCGAIVVVSDHTPDRPQLRSLRASLGQRGRAWFLLPSDALPGALVALAANGLEPKHVRVSSGSRGSVLLTAAPARPGGLVVEIVPMC